ncbi:hypothetical protein GCWU000341_00974 [Oribacterium sp. oral taxon 078 str. F0262]|nr:hypothetical protein GCWU000341_00974 [Oribacterium sp. oral taxon 078 str. F0262]
MNDFKIFRCKSTEPASMWIASIFNQFLNGKRIWALCILRQNRKSSGDFLSGYLIDRFSVQANISLILWNQTGQCL